MTNAVSTGAGSALTLCFLVGGAALAEVAKNAAAIATVRSGRSVARSRMAKKFSKVNTTFITATGSPPRWRPPLDVGPVLSYAASRRSDMKTPTRRAQLFSFCLAVVGFGSHLSCEPPLEALAPEEALAPGPALAPVAWEAEFKDSFDDGIDLNPLNLSVDPQVSAHDPKLRQRTRTAELVTRVKVRTVSRDGNGEHSFYRLGVLVAAQALITRHFAPETLELAIPDTQPGYEWFNSNQSTLQGRVFLLFIRRFQGLDGPVMHWHLMDPSAGLEAAVTTIVATDSLTGE